MVALLATTLSNGK
jgi:hypothetical protein